MITHYHLALSFGQNTFLSKNSNHCREDMHYSALQSAAYFLSQLFATYSDAQSSNSHLVATKPLPQVDFESHYSFVGWNLKLKDCILGQRAVRIDQTLYLDIALEEQLLEEVHKIQKDVWMDFDHMIIDSYLSNEERLKQIFGLVVIPRFQKKVAIFSNTNYSIDKFKYFDAANILGQFYNNEKWYFYEITELPNHQIPTIQEILKLDLVILPGSPRSVYQKHVNVEKAMRNLKAAYENCEHLKIQAICFGHQLVAYHFGVDVEKRNKCRLVEKIELNRQLIARHQFLYPLQSLSQPEILITQNHSDHVVAVPEGFDLLGKSGSCHIEGLVSKNGRIFTTQFHPQVFHLRFLQEEQAKVHQLKLSNVLQKEALRLIKHLKRQNIKDSLLIRECMRRFISQ